MKTLLLILILSIPVRLFSQEPVDVDAILGLKYKPSQVNIFDTIPDHAFDINLLIGDKWSRLNHPHFEHFQFNSDGTFSFTVGYSGGSFHMIEFYGKYKINGENNTLNLKVKGYKQRGSFQRKIKIKKSIYPARMEILGMNDIIVVVRFADRYNIIDKVYQRTAESDRQEVGVEILENKRKRTASQKQ